VFTSVYLSVSIFINSLSGIEKKIDGRGEEEGWGDERMKGKKGFLSPHALSATK